MHAIVPLLLALDESCPLFQLTVQASDHALPTPRTATVQVILTVPRDNAPTLFDKLEYAANISERVEVDVMVTEVKAHDENLQVGENNVYIIYLYAVV